MLKRQGVKRAHVKAQIVHGAEEAVEYRAHQHPDIPDSDEPMTALEHIGDMLAAGYRILRDYLGLGRGLKRLPFGRVRRHTELRLFFPHLTGDYASPTKRQPPTGRDGYRAQRRRLRGRFKHRVRYRRWQMPAGFGLVPVTLADLSDEMSEADLTLHTQIMQEAAFRAGVLTPAEGYEVLETGEWP